MSTTPDAPCAELVDALRQAKSTASLTVMRNETVFEENPQEEEEGVLEGNLSNNHKQGNLRDDKALVAQWRRLTKIHVFCDCIYAVVDGGFAFGSS